MKIKPEHLERIPTLLMTSYRSKELNVTRTDDSAIKSKIVEIISKNFAEEEAIEEEARTMLASVARVSREMDPYKMFLLAKQKLAAKKGFILLPRRWVVERSFAWTARFRRLARDFERLPETFRSLHFLAFAILMLQTFVKTIAHVL